MIDLHFEFSLTPTGKRDVPRRFVYVPRSRRRDLKVADTHLAHLWFRGLHARLAWAFGKSKPS